MLEKFELMQKKSEKYWRKQKKYEKCENFKFIRFKLAIAW